MMERDLLLGIDVGTSSVKGVLITPDGAIVAEATSQGHAMRHPHPGWAEQDPHDWWAGVVSVCRTLARSASLARVAAVGVSGQGCACTLIDASGDVVRPAIIWLDTRAGFEAEALADAWGPAIEASNGNAVGAYNIEPKLLWLERYEPESLARATRVLTTTAYVTFRLTGQAAMNRADAGIFHAYDARTGNWNHGLLEEMGLDPNLYPPIQECADRIGTVSVEAGLDTGLPAGTPVVAGGRILRQRRSRLGSCSPAMRSCRSGPPPWSGSAWRRMAIRPNRMCSPTRMWCRAWRFGVGR